MLDADQSARLKALTELIQKEQDQDKFTQLVAKLNALLDEKKKPNSNRYEAQGASSGPDAHSIRQITEELYLVGDELNKRAATHPGELSSALIESDSSTELVAFKAAVDELRPFLWHYLNEFLGKPENAIGDKLRSPT